MQALDVDSANGSVRIVAADTDEVTVRAEISEGLRRTGERREIVDGVLELHATCPSIGSNFCWVDYEVRVPRDVPITVDADNGRIEITGTTAAVDIDGDNGTIELTDVSGPIVAETDNGRLTGTALRSETVRADTDNGRVELEFAVAPMTVEASSDNGSVEVVVPDDGETYRVTMDTENGSQEQSVRSAPDSPRSLTLTTDNGSVTPAPRPDPAVPCGSGHRESAAATATRMARSTAASFSARSGRSSSVRWAMMPTTQPAAKR